MIPTLGRIVIVRTAQKFNDTNEHPAVITRVWGTGDTREGKVCVNLTVLPDCGAPFSMTSVNLYDERAECVGLQHAAWWPDRA